MSADDDCDYCYGTMGLCPKCGPFEYAPPASAGYDHARGINADTFDGRDLSGRMPDWHDSANERGWCWRDTNVFLETMYSSAERLNELAFKPLGKAIGIDWSTERHRKMNAAGAEKMATIIRNRHERRKAAAIARRKHA